MFRPINREEYVKRVSDRYDNETANSLLDSFLYLTKQISQEAGDMGEDVLYYYRQIKACQTLGKTIGLTDKEMDHFLNSNAIMVSDFYGPMLYTREEYIRYIDNNLSTEDIKKIEKEWGEKWSDLVQYYMDTESGILFDDEFCHHDENGNFIEGRSYDENY